MAGKSSRVIVRFRMRRSLCVLNVMPGVYFSGSEYKSCETLCRNMTVCGSCLRGKLTCKCRISVV